MNKFLCFLTGGHRYRDANMTTSQGSRFGWVRLTNHCVKCGGVCTFEINTLYHIAKALKERSDNEQK